MGWFDDDSSQAQAAQQVQERGASISHELLASAAAFAAAKAYENHVAENGKPSSHEFAKELLAGFAGAAVDREAETRGVDLDDREKAKRAAVDQCSDKLAQQWDQ
ncbi:hypothetical protein N431DRAFT_410969 [Stipitochalara longipes BDJ]|nr:hypothetical protein N431DRAFT_410969 [Stipitochalara longipes BDJ]